MSDNDDDDDNDDDLFVFSAMTAPNLSRKLLFIILEMHFRLRPCGILCRVVTRQIGSIASMFSRRKLLPPPLLGKKLFRNFSALLPSYRASHHRSS